MLTTIALCLLCLAAGYVLGSFRVAPELPAPRCMGPRVVAVQVGEEFVVVRFWEGQSEQVMEAVRRGVDRVQDERCRGR